MSGPLSPEEILKFKAEVTPKFVYEAINELIAETINNSTASFLFKVARLRISDKMTHLAEFRNTEFSDRVAIIDTRGWLNVENAYRAKGWNVTTDITDEGIGFFVFKGD